jgi:peptide/nickel transport system ATP-binding protein
MVKMTALLDALDVSVKFRTRRSVAERLAGAAAEVEAVAGVSLSLDRGRTLALVGESGSGKTTFARAIAGLQPIAGGKVRFDGGNVPADTRTDRKRLRRDIAMVFQDPVGSLSPRLRVRELLAEPFAIHSIRTDPRAQAGRLLDLVGLPGAMAERYPHQLSGGQARRVGVARALALEPRLIIADEPTAGLDVSVQGEVLNLLGELRERLGLAMLIITHNLHVARHVADQVAVLYLGRVVERGDAETVFAAPRHPYSAALLSTGPEPDPVRRARRLKLHGEVPSLRARPSGCEFHTRCPLARPLCAERAPPVSVVDGRTFTCHFPLGATA